MPTLEFSKTTRALQDRFDTRRLADVVVKMPFVLT